MTSVATSSGAATPQRYHSPGYRLTFMGLLRSEWIKLWSVRSVAITLMSAVFCTVGLSTLVCSVKVVTSEGGGDPGDAALTMLGAQVATLIVAAVGVITITGEYSTGMIRTSMAVAPRRAPVVLAKAVVLAGAVALTLGGAVLVAFFVGRGILATAGMDGGFAGWGATRLILGNVAVPVGIALCGLGIGCIVRSAAGAIGTLFGLLLLLPLVLIPVPDFPGRETITTYGLANSTATITTPGLGEASLTASALAFAVWVFVFLASGVFLVSRRDV